MTRLDPLRLRDLGPHWRPTFRLAWPVVIGQLGVMLMSLVDTAMVGALGRDAVGAVGLASSLFSLAFIFGIGLLMGLDHEVSVAYGARREEDVARYAVQGLWASAAISLPLTALLVLASAHMDLLGAAPELVPLAGRYLRAVAWCLPAALAFISLRQTLQAVGATGPGTVVLLLANLVNWLGCYALIRGRLGAPALGIVGSAWATNLSRLFMLLALLAWTVARHPTWWRSLAPHPPSLRALARLGGPAGLQLLFEGGVFSLATVLAARIGAVPAAAHQVVLQIASFAFMMPMGISAAGTVRVGQAIGRGDREGARLAGWSAVGLGVGCMATSAVVMLVGWRQILGVFELDPEVTALAHRLLLVAGFFQLFDGAQVTLAGVLRGLGDTVSSLAANLVGHWVIGLPVGCALAFGLGWGAVGLWIGLATGLAATATGLLWRWRLRSRQGGVLHPGGVTSS